MKKVVIHAVEIFSVLERVVKPVSCDLRKLAASRETGRSEGVAGAGVDGPVCGGRLIAD